MIGISKLYCGTVEASDPLRYQRHSDRLPSHLLQFSSDKKPVVVWNITRKCNLRCLHCYSHSENCDYTDELTTQQGFELLDDLANFGSPVVLFSGGEPLIRPDLPQLIQHARSLGLRAVISTNGTLISPERAAQFAELGLSYVGVSLDGLPATNDQFRGLTGAFDRALAGIRNCKAAGVKVGLRFTIHKNNVFDIPGIFDLLEAEDIPRVCFYHLVYAGRGSELIEQDLTHLQTRQTIDLIIDRTADLFARGLKKEVLTVDNHADGPYIYLRLLREGKTDRAAEVMELLKMNGGNSTGSGIGCVSWDGAVHPDQFWRHETLGNIKERKFSEIWSKADSGLLHNLRNRKELITGRCATCRFLNVCNANFRVRAEATTGNLWQPDPACYLSDSEISEHTGHDRKPEI